MGGVLPTESNISMTGAGLVGKSTSGAGKSGRMSQASVLSSSDAPVQVEPGRSVVEVTVSGAVQAR